MNRYEIDLSQIARNIALIRQSLPKGIRIMMMVKSNAYGVGSLALCRWLPKCGIDIVGVANVFEAKKLREAGVSLDIFVFHATAQQIPLILDCDAAVATSTLSFTKTLAAAAKKAKKQIAIHLHLDTGMTRFGANFDEGMAIAKFIKKTPFLQFEGLLSHFPCADQPWQDPFSLEQIDTLVYFKKKLHQEKIPLPKWTHIANSAGIMRFTIPDCNMVRLGIEAYGIRPSSAYPATQTRCALTLKSTLLQVSEHASGTGVSYGHIDRLKRCSQVGVIPLGYFDGIHRKYHNSHPLVKGVPVPILGNITMDFTMLDITGMKAVEGTEVTIFGYDDKGNFADPLTFAEESGTIAHELITCIGPRVPRIYIS